MSHDDKIRIIRALIFQSLIHKAYNVDDVHDFYNTPELLVTNGYVEDLNINILNDLKNIILRQTIDTIDTLDKATVINVTSPLSYTTNDVVWFKYAYDMSESTSNKDNVLFFLLGFTIEKNPYTQN